MLLLQTIKAVESAGEDSKDQKYLLENEPGNCVYN
jgi:hypothetical protein